MAALSESYGKTVKSLQANDVKAASEEYTQVYLPTVKQLFTETNQTYPLRFAKATNWCDWVKGIYTSSVVASKTMQANDAQRALDQLRGIREEFVRLHQQTESVNTADIMYTFRKALGAAAIDVGELKKLRAQAEVAKLPKMSDADKANFTKARDAWLASVDAALKGDGTPRGKSLEDLRQTTDEVYLRYGVAFE